MEKFIYKYESLDDFLNALITKPINKEVFGNNPSSESTNYNFTGTHSFKEAWNLCRYTQDEGFENFKEKFNYINFKTSNYYNREKAYKCIGYAPNVGRFLNGYPNDMNNFELVSRKRRINNKKKRARSRRSRSWGKKWRARDKRKQTRGKRKKSKRKLWRKDKK